MPKKSRKRASRHFRRVAGEATSVRPSKRRRKKIKKRKTAIKKRRRVRKKQKKEIEKKIISSFQFRGIRIKVVGIGGGGSSIVSEIAPKLKRVKFLVANTDLQALKSSAKTAKRFQFGQKLTQGLGTGMNPQLGETAALDEKERIKKVFQGEDLSILVATLGGGAGSGALPVFAKAARDSKNLTLGIFTLPFDFEGKKRKEIAEASLEKLRPDLNAFSIIPNNKIFQIIDQKTPLKEALSVINKILAENLEGLIEMIYLSGLINIDFADVKAVLEGRGRLAYLATVEVQGDNRAEEGVKKILQSPLYEYGIQGAERILFNITGSKNLTINEVERISKVISSFNPKAKIIFGLSQKDNYQNKIRITLLAVGCGEKIKAKKEAGGVKEIKIKGNKETRPNSIKKETKTKETSLRKRLFNLGDRKDKEKRVNIKVSKTALDLKEELKKMEKEIVSRENEWDAPAFLRKKSLKLR